MKRNMGLAFAVFVLLACNLLFPTQSAPNEQAVQVTPVTTEASHPPTDTSEHASNGYVETRLHPGDGDVNSLLAHEAEKATTSGLIPVVEFDATWCPPCQAINKALDEKNELMLKAYHGTYIIKLDVDEWGWKVDGFVFDAIPVFFKLDAHGKRTGEVIDGGAWGKDIPENIAPVLDKFFHTAK